MSLVKSVSLVNNELDTNGFVTTDVINYVADKHGSVVDVNSVKRSADQISEKTPGRYVVTYRYGKASGKVTVTVRSDANEGISKADAKLGKGGNVGKTWFPHELAFRGNYNVQGLDVYGQDMVKTNFYGGPESSMDGARGHMVLYQLNQVPKYALQYIPTKTLNFQLWKNYVKRIKISPYIKLGHGQSVGSTSRYIYELANWNHTKKLRSNELLQIDKKDMQVKRIWTFAVSNGERKNNRYFLNADVIDDNTMLALFHSKSKHRFEIWKIIRKGNSFKVKEAAATMVT